MPIEATRNRKAALTAIVPTTDSEEVGTARTTRTTTAAVANHFSWRRSSPTDPLNRTTAAATHPPTAATMTKDTRTGWELVLWPNGSDQAWVAATTKAPVRIAEAPPVNHATGRHRREGTCPVGKSRRRKARTPKSIE